MWTPDPGRAREPRTPSTATPSTVRDVNRSIILNLVRCCQPLSRAELADRTGMFRSSVSAVVDELVADGFLVEKRASPKGRGRVPVHLSLNPNGLRVLGVSVRAFQTFVATSGLTGSMETTVCFPTPRQPATLMKELARCLDDVRGAAGAGFREVGISVPGLVHVASGEILMLPSLPAYAGFPIASEVSALADAPATADNDCNTGALAELWLNEHGIAGVEDFAFVEIGDVGVGAGLILNGELYGGHDGTWVGEFGHMVIDPSGPACNCGRRGCWEQYVSDRATWCRYDPRTPYSPARFDKLIRLAAEGDERAVCAFRATASYLSLGLSNITFALNPRRIVLAGEITRVWDLVGETVEAAFSSASVKVRVTPARFSLEVLSLQGAVALALGKVFAGPHLG